MLLHNKVRSTDPIYPDNCVKPINTFCAQNAELLIIKVGG